MRSASFFFFGGCFCCSFKREGKKKFLDYCFWVWSLKHKHQMFASNANSKTPSKTYWICTLNKFKLQFRKPQLIIQTWDARLPSGFPTFWLWSWDVLGAHRSCLKCYVQNWEQQYPSCLPPGGLRNKQVIEITICKLQWFTKKKTS